MRVFNETQRFDQWWLRLLNLGIVALLLYSLYTWYVLKESVGNVAANDTLGQSITIVTMVIVLILFFLFKLTTEIDERGIHYRFSPFHLSKRTILWSAVQACYVRTYMPIKEYGGWGYRFTFGKNGKALNVKGNKGIQLELKSGDRLLIGTQKEALATEVIQHYFGKRD
ncbi:MAG: hypothetical protein MUO53_10005 [Maribacter sp.]|nr:hypothetical protein [Maribacter sp.]